MRVRGSRRRTVTGLSVAEYNMRRFIILLVRLGRMRSNGAMNGVWRSDSSSSFIFFLSFLFLFFLFYFLFFFLQEQ